MEKQNKKTKYLYEVVESKSPDYPVGMKFWTDKVFYTKVIGKVVNLSDVKCKDFFIKLIEIRTKLGEQHSSQP